ncbi:MAG: non-heme iron oxygenase ferredoxin subunit [Acidobacteria bacterium]|nr:MAG: non-heme iron oxygenase ferredoxin subunit [Acidobacteriota bacterium]
MAEFVRAIAASDLAPGQCVEVKVGATPVAIYNVDGTFYATSNVCLHRGGPLGQGLLEGHAVMCPWHAWSWDVKTGENVANGDLKIPTYEVKVEGGEVFVKVA